MENGRETEVNRTELVAAGRPMRIVGDRAVDPFESIGNEIAVVLRRTQDAVVALRTEARAEVDRGRVEAGQLIIDVRTQAERYAAQLCREAEVYARTVRAEADRYVTEIRREAELLANRQAALHQQLLDHGPTAAPRQAPAGPVSAVPAPPAATATPGPGAAAPGPAAAPPEPAPRPRPPASGENGKAPFFSALLDESNPEPGPQH